LRNWSRNCRFSNCSCSIWPDICRAWPSRRLIRTTEIGRILGQGGGDREGGDQGERESSSKHGEIVSRR
jgi:hypothetical protein